jgi:hypothetical protein
MPGRVIYHTSTIFALATLEEEMIPAENRVANPPIAPDLIPKQESLAKNYRHPFVPA